MSSQRTMDEDGIFNSPVLESFPAIEKEYLKVVEEPMDFTTIVEERVHYYRSITELQHDLLLVFQNCIAYNGPSSDLGKRAKYIMDAMDDAFDDAVANIM